MLPTIPLTEEPYEPTTLDDVKRLATPQIDVLGVLNSGRFYAKSVFEKLGERARYFEINPHDPMAGERVIKISNDADKSTFEGYCRNNIGHPGCDPKNTLVICDDVMEGIHYPRTFVKVLDHLKVLGYDFESDKPYHFGVIECVLNWTVMGYSGNEPERDSIRLARDF